MPLPPPWLTEWTEYAVLLIGGISAIRALLKGGTVLKYKAENLKPREVRAG